MEGKFTKMIISDSPTEFEMVDNLASHGWVLINIIKHHKEEKWIYWFQTKKRLYEKTQLEQIMKKRKH